MHYPANRIVDTQSFVIPVVEDRLKREIVQWDELHKLRELYFEFMK